MKELAPHIYSRWESEELRKKLKKIDLVIIDLDDCLYPGTTNLTLLKNLFSILFRNRQYKIFFRLIGYLPILLAMKCLQLLGLRIDNPKLSLFFYQMINNIPLPYLKAAAQPIPSNSFSGAKESLRILSQKAKTGLISLGLDVVLEEYGKQFKDGIDFCDGTRIDPLKPLDKGERTKERIDEFNARLPLAIGHNKDDLGMMMAAKEAGGLVLGLNPSKKVMSYCDIIVKAKDWQPLAEYFQELLN